MSVCRKARKQFAALLERDEKVTARHLTATERALLERHLRGCESCAFEFRLYKLGQATLNAAASPQQITPDEDFFKALRARIARGPDKRPVQQADESLTGILLATARHMIPVMAMLVLLILGATFLWKNSPGNFNSSQSLNAQSSRSDVFSEPTPDEVLENFVAVEEKWDGK